jgi:hypothetical protein
VAGGDSDLIELVANVPACKSERNGQIKLWGSELCIFHEDDVDCPTGGEGGGSGEWEGGSEGEEGAAAQEHCSDDGCGQQFARGAKEALLNSRNR